MTAPPFMPLYPADYLADTTHLTCVEHGAYLLLLMAMWRASGRLPSDDKRLAKIAKLTPDEWSEIRPTILEFFRRRGGLLIHKRVTAEIAKYDNKIVRAKAGGKASAAKKIKENSEITTRLVELKSNQPEREPEPELKGLSLARVRDIAGDALADIGTSFRVHNLHALNAIMCGKNPCSIEDVEAGIEQAAGWHREHGHLMKSWDLAIQMAGEARDRRLRGAPAYQGTGNGQSPRSSAKLADRREHLARTERGAAQAALDWREHNGSR